MPRLKRVPHGSFDLPPGQYGRQEELSYEEMIDEKYRGIRPAAGYPACPDHTEKKLLFELLEAVNFTRPGQGDLYLPAGSYLTLAKEKRLIDEVLPIARMQCGAAVRKGNPLAVKDLTSMMSSEVQLVQASPEAMPSES